MGGGNDHADDSMDVDQASGSSKPPVPAVTSGDDDDDEEVDEEQIEEYQEMLESLGAHPVRVFSAIVSYLSFFPVSFKNGTCHAVICRTLSPTRMCSHTFQTNQN